MRTQIEEIVDLGFAAPVGDPTDMFETFTRIVNERCGGVWGRRIDLRLVEIAALGVGSVDIDTLRNAACIEATEEHEAVILLNSTSFQGTAQLCVTEEHDSALIGHQALPAEYVQRGGGRLLTTATTLEANLRALAEYLISTGALDGRRVGVVAPNTPGEADATEASLVAALQAAGADLRVFDVLDCAGTSICIGAMAESVQRLAEERVDVLFPTVNAITLPAYITEMVTQGFAPGDVQFYNSDFNSHGNEVVAGLIVTFGGDAAGALYDGTLLLVHGDSGRYRLPESPARRPSTTCACASTGRIRPGARTMTRGIRPRPTSTAWWASCAASTGSPSGLCTTPAPTPAAPTSSPPWRTSGRWTWSACCRARWRPASGPWAIPCNP